MNKSTISAVILMSLYASIGAAAPASDSNHPWNGRTAAVSLTFDDGDPCHTAIVIPEMNKRGLKGTFFLIGKNIPSFTAEEKALWSRAVSNGHELGDHSMTHPQPDALSTKELMAETLNTEKLITQGFKTKVISYAYPFGKITEPLKKIVRKNFIAGRGGYGSDYYLTFDNDPDWADIPSQVTMTALSLETYKGWIDEAIRRKAWTVLMIHGVEGTQWGWEPVPMKVFEGLLDYLAAKTNEVWTVPFGEAAGYYKKIRMTD